MLVASSVYRKFVLFWLLRIKPLKAFKSLHVCIYRYIYVVYEGCIILGIARNTTKTEYTRGKYNFLVTQYHSTQLVTQFSKVCIYIYIYIYRYSEDLGSTPSECQVFYLFRCVHSSVQPLRSVGRSNFDKGRHNLTTLIQKSTYINESCYIIYIYIYICICAYI